MIPQHSFDVQMFHGDCLVFTSKPCRYLVKEIPADICDTFMDSSNTDARSFTVGKAAAAHGGVCSGASSVDVGSLRYRRCYPNRIPSTQRQYQSACHRFGRTRILFLLRHKAKRSICLRQPGLPWQRESGHRNHGSA